MNENLLQFVWKYFSSHSDDMIVIRKSMVDICDGDLSAAMMISQLLYWHDKYKDQERWMKISREEWFDQCRLSPWKIREANKFLKKSGFMEIKIKRFNKLTCSHYRINFENLKNALLQYIESESRKSGNHPSEELRKSGNHPSNGRAETTLPLTENTSQSITTTSSSIFPSDQTQKEITPVDFIEIYKEVFPNNPKPYQRIKNGAISKDLMEAIKNFREDYPLIVKGVKLTKEIFKDYLMVFKDTAPNYCLGSYEKKGVTLKNGLMQFIKGEVAYNFLTVEGGFYR